MFLRHPRSCLYFSFQFTEFCIYIICTYIVIHTWCNFTTIHTYVVCYINKIIVSESNKQFQVMQYDIKRSPLGRYVPSGLTLYNIFDLVGMIYVILYNNYTQVIINVWEPDNMCSRERIRLPLKASYRFEIALQ